MIEKTCPDCLGDGWLEYEIPEPDYRYGGELVGKVMDCQTCDGSGYIETEEDPI